MPGMMPASSITFANGTPAAVDWRMVSSWRIAPLMYSPRPGVVSSSSRHARRLDSLLATPTAPKRLPMVPGDSSMAMMPLPAATRACAVCARSSMLMTSRWFAAAGLPVYSCAAPFPRPRAGPPMPLSPRCLAAACLSLATASAGAAEGLRLDGIPDEPLWREAQVFDDFRVTSPYTLDPATHPARALLRSLPEGLAVAIIAHQPRDVPRLKPRAGRDANVDADRVNFSVDFDGDGRLGYNFMVTLGNAIAD